MSCLAFMTVELVVRGQQSGAAGERMADAKMQSTNKRKRAATDGTEVAAKKKTGRRRPMTSSNPTAEAAKVVVANRSRGNGLPSTSTSTVSTPLSVHTSRDNFVAQYLELDKLAEGGFGSVYAGYRRTDNLAVAIKHIPRKDVEFRQIILSRKKYKIPMEVLLMQKVAGGPESTGKSASISLLEWYDLKEEILLVMERPVPCLDLLQYMNGPLEEQKAKIIMKQLVEAAIHMLSEGVFHRDIKSQNILIETSSDVPRVWVIDFGCGCFVRKTSFRSFSGTSAYIPPEFYREGNYKAEPTTVWQLGALLYEMLNGNKHFSTTLFLRSQSSFNKDMKELEVSQDCLMLLKMCLTVKPKDRITLENMRLHPWFNQPFSTLPKNSIDPPLA